MARRVTTYIRNGLAVALAAAAFGQVSQVRAQPELPAQPQAQPQPSADPEVEFAERFKAYAEMYLSDAPAQARDLQEAVKEFVNERAAELLRSANLPKKPGRLSEQQVAVLQRILDKYVESDAHRTAREYLEVHQAILNEPQAQEALAKIGLKGPEDELTPEQQTQLFELQTQFPKTESARTAGTYLSRQRQRDADRALTQLLDDYLKTPGARDALNRFAERRLEFALTLVASQQTERLEQLIRNLPGTPAAERAKTILAQLESQIKQQNAADAYAAERSRRYRYYWDRRYPPRIWNPPPLPRPATKPAAVEVPDELPPPPS